jgi:hypothetical protein
MRNRGWSLFLFFAVEALAITTMVCLLDVSRRLACEEFLGRCTTPSGAGLILGIAVIMGELAMLKVVLRLDRPMWGALVMFGLVSLFAFFALLMTIPWPTSMFLPQPYARLLAGWHLLVAVPLLGSGLVAGLREAFARHGRVVDGRRGEDSCEAA